VEKYSNSITAKATTQAGAHYFWASRRNGVLRDQVRQHPQPLPGPTQGGYEPMNYQLKTYVLPRCRLSNPHQMVAQFAKTDQTRFE
jgi:hypothetical protein